MYKSGFTFIFVFFILNWCSLGQYKNLYRIDEISVGVLSVPGQDCRTGPSKFIPGISLLDDTRMVAEAMSQYGLNPATC